MLKEDYPIYFDDTELSIRHRVWSRTYSNLTSENRTEAGTDDVEYIRFGKTRIRAQFRCTDTWTATLASFSGKPSINVRFYDIEEDGYITKVMRMTNFSIAEVYNSDSLEVTNGIYDISFDLEEF